MSENLNLVQKLAKIRAICDTVVKNKKGFNYTYSDVTMILAKVKAGMDRYGVSLVPNIVPGTGRVEKVETKNVKIDKSGKTVETVSTEMLFTADMVYTWYNNDIADDTISVPWFVTGSMADCAQAMGSGLTYTMRQFLTSYFQIAQGSDQDIDAYRSRQKEAEELENKQIVETLLIEIDGMIKSFMAGNPDKKEEAVQFISRYVKDAKYLSIKDPGVAGRLLNDFRAKFIKEEE